jgi:hypothetical protein
MMANWDISDMLRRLDRYSSAKAADLLEQGNIGTLPNNVRRFISRTFKCLIGRKGYKEGGWGLLIAAYHYIIEWFPQLETGSCDAFAPCSTPYFREFGFVTLSFMAGCGFIAVLTLLLLLPEEDQHGQQDHTPEYADATA